MAQDDDKKIDDLQIETESLRNFETFLKSNTEFKFKRQQQKMVLVTFVLAIYLLLAISFLFIFRSSSTILSLPFINSSSDEIVKLNIRQNYLEQELVKLLSHSTSTLISTSSLDILNSRMLAIEDSINLDPEKAVTAILIRDQQRNLDTDFKELKDAQIRLENKVDNFVTSVIIVPIIVFVLGLLTWFIQARLSRKEK